MSHGGVCLRVCRGLWAELAHHTFGPRAPGPCGDLQGPRVPLRLLFSPYLSTPGSLPVIYLD